MVAIRLQRIGKKNRPSYRVVASDSSKDLYGKQLEILGNYDPIAQPKTINLKPERIKYWLSVGAKPSATVHNLLVSHGIIAGKKVRSWKPKKKKLNKSFWFIQNRYSFNHSFNLSSNISSNISSKVCFAFFISSITLGSAASWRM